MAAVTTAVAQHSMTVGGAQLPTAQTFEVINPSTGSAFASAPYASKADVDAAVAAAKAAFPAWAASPIRERKVRSYFLVLVPTIREIRDFYREM
eukprot:SAG31_NODE_18657_length_627_cov_1.405303_1_plen_93_part_10